MKHREENLNVGIKPSHSSKDKVGRLAAPSRSVIRRIVSKANTAPSGDNCQPWRFVWDGEFLRVLHKDQVAKHELNHKNVASIITLGCLLEAIDMAAKEEGYAASYNLFDLKKRNPMTWAMVHFKGDPIPQPIYLSSQMTHRYTDRRIYKGGNFEEIGSQDLLELSREFDKARFYFAQDPSKDLLEYVEVCDVYLWTQKKVVRDLMKWMRLSKKEENSTSDGMHRASMVVNWMDGLMLRVFRAFPKAFSFLWPLGIKQKITGLTKKQIQSSAGLISVTVTEQSQDALVQAGRLTYRLWVFLNYKDYGVQPLTVPSLFSYLAESDQLPKNMTAANQSIFRLGRRALYSTFKFGHQESPVWLMRTGKVPIKGIEKLRSKRLRSENLIVFNDCADAVN